MYPWKSIELKTVCFTTNFIFVPKLFIEIFTEKNFHQKNFSRSCFNKRLASSCHFLGLSKYTCKNGFFGSFFSKLVNIENMHLINLAKRLFQYSDANVFVPWLWPSRLYPITVPSLFFRTPSPLRLPCVPKVQCSFSFP
jgi:hypothetical protein